MLMRRLLQARDGSALVEFAFVMPLLLVMFLGGYVVSDMIHCYRKVTVGARSLADLISRNVSPASVPAASVPTLYMNAAQITMSPLAVAKMGLQITELRVCDASHAYVVWTQAQSAGAATTSSMTAGSVVSIPANMITTPMVPTSPDGSNVCSNTTSSANKVKVGTAGGYLYYSQVTYAYKPVIGLGTPTVTTMGDQVYMIPRMV